MTLPRTAKTVGELAEILSHLPPYRIICISDDTTQDYAVEVTADLEYVDQDWNDIRCEVIRLWCAHKSPVKTST